MAASGMLLLLVVVLAVLATWRAESDRGRHEELEQRAAIVAALGDARAQFFRGATLLTAAAYEEDPALSSESYPQAQGLGDEALERARAGMAAIDDAGGIAVLDDFSERIGLIREQVNGVLAFGATADKATRVQLGLQYYPLMWPEVESLMVGLEDLSTRQQAESVAAGAAADRAAGVSLVLAIVFGTFTLLSGAAIIIFLAISVVRPLAQLQTSARAVAAGNLEAMAKVSGPTEVSSLVREFNEMIDQRKRVEAALREGEAKYRHFFETILDIFYRTDNHGIITEISPSVERFGYTREQLIGSQVMELYENPEQRSALVGAILKHGSVDDYEIRLRRGDGRVIDISVSAYPLHDEGGAFAGTEGTLRDITERKRAEQALRDSEETHMQ
jgi:PAS domain S-box-containing protein